MYPKIHQPIYFVDQSEMIKLETNDSCLVSVIREVKTTQEYVFVNDSKNLFQFDRNGKFIRKIGSVGRGPHEYISISCFTCSPETKRIYIGTLGKILCFDFEANFIEEIDEYKLFDQLYIYNNQLWAFFTEYGKSDDGKFENRNKVYKYSLEGGVLEDSLLFKTIRPDRQAGTISPHMQYLSETSEHLYIYCPVLIAEPIIRDTLYYLQGNKLIPAVKIDFSDIAVTTDKSKNISIQNINRTQRYLFVCYNYKQRNRLFLYDFSASFQYNLTDGFNDDIFETGKIMPRPLDLKLGQMYFVKDGYELEGIIDGVDENSNPVLFIVDLK